MHTYPDIAKRLKRAEGHLRSVIAMLEAERSCLDVAQQLQAVESAVSSAKKALVQDHVDHCLEAALQQNDHDVDAMLRELKAISKYL